MHCELEKKTCQKFQDFIQQHLTLEWYYTEGPPEIHGYNWYAIKYLSLLKSQHMLSHT